MLLSSTNNGCSSFLCYSVSTMAIRVVNSYSLDSQVKSSDLAGKFVSANSPVDIAAAVTAVESHLFAHSPDQNRHFFSIAFPAFLCKFFGFIVSSSSPQKSPYEVPGWIDTVTFSNDSDLAAFWHGDNCKGIEA